MDYREEMKQLRDFLNQQSYLYYVLDAPVIPDYEYDRLNRRLEELEEGRLLLLRTPGTSRLHGVYFWREIASASKCF